MTSQNITFLFTSLALEIPLFLVCLAGVVLGIIHRDRLGSATPLAVTGFGALFLIWLVFPIIRVMAPSVVSSTGVASIQVVYGVIQGVQCLLQAVAFSLVAGAVFSNRPAPTKPEPPR